MGVRFVAEHDLTDLQLKKFFESQTLDALNYKILVALKNSLIDVTENSVNILNRVNEHISIGNIKKDCARFKFRYSVDAQYYYLDQVIISVRTETQLCAVKETLNTTENWFYITFEVLSGKGKHYMLQVMSNQGDAFLE